MLQGQVGRMQHGMHKKDLIPVCGELGAQTVKQICM